MHPNFQVVPTTGGTFAVTVMLGVVTGTGPLQLMPTRNCTECCSGNSSDFDVSSDRITWYDGAPAGVTSTGERIQFNVDAPITPKYVRYTANKIFPQCAVANALGLPVMPFDMAVSE